MSNLQEFKCPNCGGSVEFDPHAQKLKCPYCDSEFEVESLKEYGQQLESEQESKLEWNQDLGSTWQEDEIDKMRLYVCQSCGGEIVTDDTTAATMCPYCGNAVVVNENFKADLRPDLVIPFRLDKQQAKQMLMNHYKGKKLLPKYFKNENIIEEIKGIYVPFWLFDAEVDAKMRYKGTRTRFWSNQNYDYTETSFYAIVREGNIGFTKVPVDGSSKISDELMEAIEPFDIKEATDFQTAYLAGYFADRYDVDMEQSIDRANQRIVQSTKDAFATSASGYGSLVCEHAGIHLDNNKVQYALYPVWLLTTKWQGKNYTFAMNGQTGKFVGNLPCDRKAALTWFIGISLISMIVFYVVILLLWNAGILG
ncbi:MAG: hypothetical protein MR210_03210 [Erysipelotrichaceae bacterium]|nr:hypothetical protein [Erysipelotrichaceae bacterium]MDY5252425.1 hypothetical protein [Erysipelotrichaceae bacterium]